MSKGPAATSVSRETSQFPKAPSGLVGYVTRRDRLQGPDAVRAPFPIKPASEAGLLSDADLPWTAVLVYQYEGR